MDLTRNDILQLLDELIELLIAKSIKGVITIYGGSAVSYYHDERGVTRDIDSIITPSKEVLEVAKELSEIHPGLQENWLNMAIVTIMPPVPDDNPSIYYQDDNLKVQFGSEEYLLAMKAVVPRRSEQDKYDAALLFNSLGLKSWLEINTMVSKYFPGSGNWGSQELFWEEVEYLAGELKA
ncbi:hypothetical protein FACS1894104_5360 [Actinomycetota bacterium]|nr:hypothetical protein FACS1894104_5360 [Actinomycetota bacterium]